MQERLLTKSRYKLGLSCPTKLFYTGKPEYANSAMDDPFIAALAEGGYQVGELAKYYVAGGHTVSTRDVDEAVEETNKLLEQENVVIYEAAILFKNMFVRIDILVKNGNKLDLIEVKSKSYGSDTPLFGTRGNLVSTWIPYVQDVAFQKYVLAHAFPASIITSSLMMANKDAVCTIDGLNQMFQIERTETSMKVIVNTELTDDELSHHANEILINVSTEDALEAIHEIVYDNGNSFEEQIIYLADSYTADNKIVTSIGRHCKKCEYRCTDDTVDLKDGFKECWNGKTEDTILDIWNLNFRTRDKLFAQGKSLMRDLTIDDINIKEDDNAGITNSERQWMQIEKVQNDDSSIYFDADGMREEMETWVYPLHFIDFETATVALPFTKGRKPYEGIAFQFSHHIYHADGRIEHASEFIKADNGVFPNFDFIRALKTELEKTDGTVFRYADHENTFLNLILQQLENEESAATDFDEIRNFIMCITHSSRSAKVKWTGERDMVDMLYLVKRYYYDPAMKGSNSLKVVLPSILNNSTYLQKKYCEPIYGSSNGIASINFSDWTWVEKQDGNVIDPYKKLPKLFNDVSDSNMLILSEDSLDNGGAAMIAYGRIQYTNISTEDKTLLTEGLLRYCELDTHAMVMLYEAWLDMCK